MAMPRDCIPICICEGFDTPFLTLFAYRLLILEGKFDQPLGKDLTAQLDTRGVGGRQRPTLFK